MFLLQVVAAFLGLLFALGIALGVGWLSGLAFGVVWYLVYRSESGDPPPDGYPWMFWKAWPYWLAARRVKKAQPPPG